MAATVEEEARMAENKTQPGEASAEDFIAAVADPARREDCRRVAAMMQAATGAPPVMWGASIVGFGRYHYTYASGRSGDWMIVGFSPRKNDLTLYLMPGLEDQAERLARLGRHKTGKSCLYLKKLADVDLEVHGEMIAWSVQAMAPQRTDQPAV
jgi:hypothetical protein